MAVEVVMAAVVTAVVAAMTAAGSVSEFVDDRFEQSGRKLKDFLVITFGLLWKTSVNTQS